jgi:hypothetical protein
MSGLGGQGAYRTSAAPIDLYDTTDGKIKKFTVDEDLFDVKANIICEGVNHKEDSYSISFKGDKEPEEKRFYKYKFPHYNNGAHHLDDYMQNAIRIGYLIVGDTRIPIARLIKIEIVEKISHPVKYDWYQAQA